MDYDEEPDPPNRQRDGWIMLYKKVETERDALKARVAELETALHEATARGDRVAWQYSREASAHDWTRAELLDVRQQLSRALAQREEEA